MAENTNGAAGDAAELDRVDEISATVAALRERRDRVDAGRGRWQASEDAALEKFAATAVAIEAAWTAGARRVQELELEAERVRDEVRARSAELEAEQQQAIAELAEHRPVDEVAVLLGLPVGDILAVVEHTDAGGSVPGTPPPSDELPLDAVPEQHAARETQPT